MELLWPCDSLKNSKKSRLCNMVPSYILQHMFRAKEYTVCCIPIIYFHQHGLHIMGLATGGGSSKMYHSHSCDHISGPLKKWSRYSSFWVRGENVDAQCQKYSAVSGQSSEQQCSQWSNC